MKTKIFAISIYVLTCIVACYRGKDSKEIAEEKNKEKFENKTDERDAQFIVETANRLHTLVALSDVAIEKNSKAAAATAKKVKPDYQLLLGEMESFANAHVISVPKEPSEESTERIRKMLDEKPSEFDSKWCSQVRKDNKDLIGKLERYGEKTEDMNLKTWLNSALPQVRSIQDKLVDMENKLSSTK